MYSFISVINYYEWTILDESYFKKHAHYSKVVWVSEEELKKDTRFRVFGIIPGCLGGEERLKVQAGAPKFNFGQYYNPDFLLLAEDVIEYGFSHLKFDKIRTARMISQVLLG